MSTSGFRTPSAAGDDDVDGGGQLQPADTLIDRGVDDTLDEGYSPPERPYPPSAFALTETMDQMVSEEEQDPASRLNVLFDEREQQRADEAEREAEFPERREVGGARAGRLVAPDWGFGEDTEAELVAQDVGISGGAASAEEAAVHIIDDE
jgi:Family of unknown function (DUF5709)